MKTNTAQKLPSFPIFRTGTHTPMQGDALRFSVSDLEQMAKAYNPAVHTAPIVLGHPKTDTPAHGWIGSLKVVDDTLFAQPSEVAPDFAAKTREGAYRKVSASLYRPTEAANPTPGHWYLKHVGFLGATAPAVSGLGTVKFAGEGGVSFALDFGDSDDPWAVQNWRNSVAAVLLGIRDYMVEKEGVEAVNKILPEWRVNDVLNPPVPPTPTDGKNNAVSYSTAQTDQPKEKQVEDKPPIDFAAKEKALEQREQALTKREAEYAQASATEFCEGLVAQGRIPAESKQAFAGVLASLTDEASADFADGEGKEHSPRETLRNALGGLPTQVPFGEAAAEGSEPALMASSFAAPQGASVDIVRAQVDAQAQKLAEEKDIPYTEAVAKIEQGATR